MTDEPNYPPTPPGVDPQTWADLMRLQFHARPFDGPDGERLARPLVRTMLELDAEHELTPELAYVRDSLRATLQSHGVLPGGAL